MLDFSLRLYLYFIFTSNNFNLKLINEIAYKQYVGTASYWLLGSLNKNCYNTESGLAELYNVSFKLTNL